MNAPLTYDYRAGRPKGGDVPRGYQVRTEGPPLLFMTDLRMTILVTLALADGVLRVENLWRHLGKKNVGCLRDLHESGLVCKWKLGRGQAYAALDPAHPAAAEVRELLLCVAQAYPGFSKPSFHADDRVGGSVPVRRGRRRDVRYTFGEPTRTWTLLMVYLVGEVGALRMSQMVPRLTKRQAQKNLWMYRAFGVLAVRRVRRGLGFRFVETDPLADRVVRVLSALDRAMPQWRIVAELRGNDPRPLPRDSRATRRKSGRWKW